MKKFILILFLSCFFIVSGKEEKTLLEEIIANEIIDMKPDFNLIAMSGVYTIKRPEAFWNNLEDKNTKAEEEFNSFIYITENYDETQKKIALYEDADTTYYKEVIINDMWGKIENLIEETNYASNKKNGKYYIYTKYYPSKSSQSGGSSYYYYGEEEEKKEGEYSYNDKVGTWKELDFTCQYSNNILHGNWKDNKTGKTFQYINGFKHGVWEEGWRNEGEVEIITYKIGIKDGEYRRYKNGKLSIKGMMENGNQVGEWLYFDELGSVVDRKWR